MADFEEPLSDEEKVWRQINYFLYTSFSCFREILVLYIHVN